MAQSDYIEYLSTILPFDRLDAVLLEQAAAALDLVYFAKDSEIPLDRNQQAFIYIVMKGKVAECSLQEAGKHCALYGENSQFGAAMLLDSQVAYQYTAVEEVLLYRLPYAVFESVVKASPEFEAFYFQDITQKLKVFHQKLQMESSSEAMMDSVKIAPLHALVEVPSGTSIQRCVELMEQHATDACVIQTQPEAAIVTSSDLLSGLAIQGFDIQSSVDALGTSPIITIDENDFLFNALLKMTRYGLDRLIVRNADGFIGVLHQKELLSLFANQSSLVMLTLERASSFDELKKVTQQIDDLILGLANKGVKTHYIAKLVNELHRKLQQKLWQILDVENTFSKVTFFVMGSEGRAEQVVRTDQDNALIYDETISETALQAFCEHFTNKLIELGFPRCPGNIMVSNAQWRRTQADFENQVLDWLKNPSMEAFMNLAILFDAQVIHGDESRLTALKMVFSNEINKRQMFLVQFAKSVLQFETPIGLFGRLITQKDEGHSIDLKKGGIFPIVHGVRCLALEKGIEKTNTHWRIRELINRNVFSEDFGVELGETLNYLNTLRLQSMLEKKQSGKVVDNAIETHKLSHFQQDLLKDAFGVVNKFKKFIEQHFKMEAFL